MASLHSLPTFGSHGTKTKDGKSKSKSAVRPILKKWSQSEKEKKSLDLDRGWDEQDDQFRSVRGWDGGSSLAFYDEAAAGPDVGGGGGIQGAVGGVGALGGATSARRFNHSRSISGTSHVSVATSNSSNGAATTRQTGAPFVHPFQQMPRTSTPPLLSYANSLASIADARDYSPTTITEDEIDLVDNVDPPPIHHYHNSHSNNTNTLYIHHAPRPSHPINSNSHSQPTLNLQRPSLASQRTSSFTDVSNAHSPKPQLQPPLRVNTSRTSSSVPAQSSRLANVSSRSDLYLDRTLESPTSLNIMSTSIASPSSSVAPMSPLRTSLDGGFPRLRAKSDLDTATRAEHLRAARRKFELKERAKDEKYAREEIKRRERADNKRAYELERQAAALHKEQLAAKAREEAAELEEALQRGKHHRKVSVASSGRPSLSLPRPSLSLGRPSTSRKNTSSQLGENEKFLSSSYDSTDPRSPPAYGRAAGSAHSVQFSPPKRKNTAKKKTHGAWTAFILWLRTKLLRMGRD
ncbi:hypothetical protein F5Y19DRAFT_475972 [Xylariaceae sp. FL1651]|nr:hypothetical protein F5Y19DRAFT_475972 [Xylariaceae sp. FL1651]